MDKRLWQKIQPILDQALMLEGEERKSFLDTSCDGRNELRNNIDTLLDSMETAEPFWERILRGNEAFTHDLINHHLHKPARTPSAVGPYRLKQRIASGGMADVYRAERDDGEFNQIVAVKIVREGLNLHHHIIRFQQERQILASLDHPHIARLLDGGVTEQGLPYLVMEYVDGIPITEYCKAENCSLDNRLHLFKQVCSAVQFAHRNLIVHRDLKPDNILVTKQGRVKILDFGIAKLLDTTLTEQTLIETQAGMRVMSLAYAAPEQLTSEPITTATDVYSLGLLIYELLTDLRPFELKDKTISAAELIIRTKEPDQPSLHNTRWQSRLRGDLDAIVCKALRKEPEERYESAAQLLEELERFEQSLPVKARRDTTRYRLQKWYMRNQRIMWTAAVMVLFLCGFAIYHTVQITRQRAVAEREAETAKEVSEFLVQLFSAANPTGSQGREITAKELLQKGVTQINQLSDQPQIQANLLSTMGQAFSQAGYYDEADSLLSKSLLLHTELYGPNSIQAASAFRSLGSMQMSKRNFKLAIPHYKKALNIYRQKTGQEKALASSLLKLGELYRDTNQLDSAEVFIEEGVQLLRQLFPPGHPELISAKQTLAYLYRAQQKYAAAEKLYLEVIRQLKKSATPDLSNLIATYNNLGYLYSVQGRFAEAEIQYRQALDHGTILWGNDHPTVLMIMMNLASVLNEQKKFKEEELTLKKRVALTQQRLGDNHWRTGAAMEALSQAYLEDEAPNIQLALTLIENTIQIYSTTLGTDHTWTIMAQLKKSLCLSLSGESAGDTLFQENYRKLKQRSNFFSSNDEKSLNRVINLFIAHQQVEKAKQLSNLLKKRAR